MEQRNLALDWLKGHLEKAEDKRGVMYFMDDDNTYSLKIFDEVSNTTNWQLTLFSSVRAQGGP